jgi:hypothetical protein
MGALSGSIGRSCAGFERGFSHATSNTPVSRETKGVT